jgi:hypothetical protein
VLKLGRLEYLELKLVELRRAADDASGVALAQLTRQEREVFEQLAQTREAERQRAHDPDEDLTEEQALHQVLLPAIRGMGRRHVEEIYGTCLEVLGLVDDSDSGSTKNERGT